MSTRTRFRLKTNFFFHFPRNFCIHACGFQIVFAIHMAHKSKGMVGAIATFQDGTDLELTNSFLDFSHLEHAPKNTQDSQQLN